VGEGVGVKLGTRGLKGNGGMHTSVFGHSQSRKKPMKLPLESKRNFTEVTPFVPVDIS
jgi:hypothetical protein